MNRNLLRYAILCAFIILLFCIPLFITGRYQLHILIMIGMAVILAVSLRFIFNTGLLSLGHGGMMSVGAYTSTILVIELGVNSWIAMLLGGLAAVLIAWIVGFPFVRLKGMYFALVTVFFSEIIKNITIQWKSVTGGTFGIYGITGPDPIFGIDFSTKAEFYYMILVIVLISIGILYAIEHSRAGITWRSIKQSDSLSESVGVNTALYKVMAFSIGSFFAGITGAFFSQYITVITPDAFGFVYSVYVVVYMIVGGVGSFIGPIIGATLLVIIPETTRVMKEYQPFVFSGVLIIVIFFLRDGIAGIPQLVREKMRKRKEAHA